MKSKNYLSYKTILEDIRNFRRSGGVNADDFSKFDVPSRYYFKIFFYFHNGDVDNTSKDSGYDTGLLAPTWEIVKDENDLKGPFYMYNSAWAYFMMNSDPMRARKVKQFVSLLSNISSDAPWYFSELTGLDAAIERKQVMEKDFKINDEPYKIDIKCLPDAIDDRIGTLLDLYRDISFDWTNKLQLLPRNLRKFDMGIYVFSSPITNIHSSNDFKIPEVKKQVVEDGVPKEVSKQTHNFNFDNHLEGDDDKFAVMDIDSSSYITSYKYFELHNCEIDYSSSKTGFGSMINKEGFSPEYTISINFDDVYEFRYNEYLMNIMGDLVLNDSHIPVSQLTRDRASKLVDELEKRLNIFEFNEEEASFEDGHKNSVKNLDESTTNKSLGSVDNSLKTQIKNIAKNIITKPDFSQFGQGVLDQADALGKDAATSLLKRALLGNLHTISLSKASAQVGSLAQGNILGTARAVQDYYSNFKSTDKDSKVDNIGNLHEQPKTISKKVEKIGNLHKSNSLSKNI